MFLENRLYLFSNELRDPLDIFIFVPVFFSMDFRWDEWVFEDEFVENEDEDEDEDDEEEDEDELD